MGFIAPALPFLAKAGIGLGAAAGGSLLGGIGGGVPSSITGPLQQTQRLGLESGQSLLGMGQRGLSAPMDYYSRILSGDRGQALSALAPQVQQVGEGYNALRQATANLAPRSGGSATLLQHLPYQQMRDINTLLQSARPQAAQGLGQLGGTALQGGANALFASTSAGRDLLQAHFEQQQLQRQLGGQIGQGIFSLLQGQPGQGNSVMDQINQWFASRGNKPGNYPWQGPPTGIQ